MRITDHFYNTIKQRLVYCEQELADSQTDLYDCAYFEGRVCELTFMIEQLDQLRNSEAKLRLLMENT